MGCNKLNEQNISKETCCVFVALCACITVMRERDEGVSVSTTTVQWYSTGGPCVVLGH